MNKKIMKDQADRNFKNISRINLSIQDERLKKQMLLEGKCTKCGQQKYGFFRGVEDRIADLIYKQLAYKDPTDPTGSTWVFHKNLNPDEVLERILETL